MDNKCLKNRRPSVEFMVNQLQSKKFGLEDTHPIWTKQRLTRLTESIYNDNEEGLEKKFLTLDKFTNAIRRTIRRVLENTVEDDTILRIYWEEFKLFRRGYKSEYNKAIELGCANNAHLAKFIVELFDKHNITINPDHDSVYTMLENYMISNSYKECKICYNRGVDGVFIHGSHNGSHNGSHHHACAICTQCAMTYIGGEQRTNTACPFCKLPIERFVKMLIP